MKNKFKFGRVLLAAVLAVGTVAPSMNMVYADDTTTPAVEKKEEVVKVTFKLEEGALAGQEIAPVEVKKGEKLAKPADPKVTDGYKFTNWYLGDKVFDFDTVLDLSLIHI